MERRKFLLGVGGTAIGGSTLIGSGAFSRIESQRRVKIEVAEDPDAYLGLDGCPDSPNSSYTEIDDSGHLAVEMSPENENADNDLGEGVNSDSRTWFDNVFQICNQGKDEICVWIGDDEDWPRVDDDEFDEEDYAEYDGDRRVDFYIGDNDDRSIVGAENAYPIAVGECVCIGIKTNTKGLEAGDQLLDVFDDEIVIHADVDCPENDNREARGETAWALKRTTERTEKRLNSLQNISRWGWYIPYEESGGQVEADLIAGAGNNAPDAGDNVADVTIDDDGETLSIDIEMDEEWTLDNSEVFAGSLERLEDTRAAPGQFPFKSNDEFDAASYEIDLDDDRIDGELEVIAIHADVTTEE